MQIRKDVLVVLLMGEYPEWRTKKMREAGNTCREARTPRLFSERVLDQIECMQFPISGSCSRSEPAQAVERLDGPKVWSVKTPHDPNVHSLPLAKAS